MKWPKTKEQEDKEIKDSEEATKELEDWKRSESQHVNIPEFKIPKQLMNVVLSGSDYHGLILLGEGGIGKTVMSLSVIKNQFEPCGWEYLNGYTTPLALYEFLYNNRKKKVLIMDDVEGLFNNPVSLGIMKGALWDTDGKRIVQYASKSDKMELPGAFTTEAKIIILCNKIPKQADQSMRALLSRTISYEFNLNYETKYNICCDLVMQNKELTDLQKSEIIHILEKNTNEATKDFNFRTLKKAISFVKYNPEVAETLFKETTTEDELKSTYLSLDKNNTVKLQCKKFCDLTGKSRATFFRVKKQLEVLVS